MLKNSDFNDLSLINLEVNHDTLSQEKNLVPIATRWYSTSFVIKKNYIKSLTQTLYVKIPLPFTFKHYLKLSCFKRDQESP